MTLALFDWTAKLSVFSGPNIRLACGGSVADKKESLSLCWSQLWSHNSENIIVHAFPESDSTVIMFKGSIVVREILEIGWWTNLLCLPQLHKTLISTSGLPVVAELLPTEL